MTIPMDDLPPMWRTIVRTMAGKIVGLEKAKEDAQAAADEAIDELFEGHAVLLERFGQLRRKAMEAKRQKFDAISKTEFQSLVEAEIEEAFRRAAQAIERRRQESMPVS